jgi:hypothetical protein
MTPAASLIPELPELTEPPRPDVDDSVIREARRRARRRRRRYALTVVVLAVATLGLAVFADLGSQPSSPGTATADAPELGAPVEGEFHRVAWCVPDPAGKEDPILGEEFVVGAGPEVKTWCSFNPGADAPPSCPSPCRVWDAARANHLFQIGGTTILAKMGGTYLVADGQLTRLGDSSNLGISHNGNYLATTSGQCGEVNLQLRDVASTHVVATSVVPDLEGLCARIGGIDDAGRVYLRVYVEDRDTRAVLMYDARSDRWASLSNVPRVDGRIPDITYVTDTGIAVGRESRRDAGGGWVALSSIEGDVDSSGRFTAQRQVPVGAGVWSPDRSFVAEARFEGVVVRPAADLGQRVLLQLPGPARPGANIQWASPTSVLVKKFDEDSSTYRCDIRSGDCKVVHRDGVMALGENAWYGG